MGGGFSTTRLVPLHVFIICSFLLLTFGWSAATPKLHQDEVRALKIIGNRFGKKDWDFNKDPCSGRGNWSIPVTRKGFETTVTCDCTFNANSTCHVVAIALKGQNFSGGVPPEFSKLRHLKRLDLSRNYLNGTIPLEWSSMNLTDLSFMGNRLSGQFPKALTKIITLSNLSLEGNHFSGPIPTDIGNLVNLHRLVLSSNSFTGELPVSLSKLANLTDMRISDNNFTGKIPDFIRSWTQIEKLHMQGCSLEGPIPSSISELTSLSDLRISDLRGRGSSFPPVSMESMKTLILRNCLINGEIPESIGKATELNTLDLSFNNLTGEIPSSFVYLARADFIYLTGNKLSGPIPEWILSRNKNADVSYNNFTWDSSAPFECPRGSVNLVESYSSSADKVRVLPCLKQNFSCPGPISQYSYSLNINCGGGEVVINNSTKFEPDTEPRGASMYYSRQNWAFSSTGIFMDNDLDADDYIITKSSALNNVSAPLTELYRTARASPISLTYYGLCLGNGNYIVNLHFAEIVFTSDRSFNSLGKRIFDVYIQGKLVVKDFNIETEAGGAQKPIIKTFIASVTSHTLKIHFYWAGKGTTGIPLRGIYGPLISAISVEPNFKPPKVDGKENNVGVVLGVAAGALFLALLVLVLCMLWRKGCLGRKISVDRVFMFRKYRNGNEVEEDYLDQVPGMPTRFSHEDLKAATDNFSKKLGEGGFGSVFEGTLKDGTKIAVKCIEGSAQVKKSFFAEVESIGSIHHVNLVRLIGFCADKSNRLLVYGYMSNGSLDKWIYHRNQEHSPLDWKSRRKIILDIAKGLAYLHEHGRQKIIHLDIKPQNILLDENYNAKVSDFGLSKLIGRDQSQVVTTMRGTPGYLAPEWLSPGITEKVDVYSFGVVVLETLCGRKNFDRSLPEESMHLLSLFQKRAEEGQLLDLVDKYSEDMQLHGEEVVEMMKLAAWCLQSDFAKRPSMSVVVKVLDGVMPVLQDINSTFSNTPLPKPVVEPYTDLMPSVLSGPR